MVPGAGAAGGTGGCAERRRAGGTQAAPGAALNGAGGLGPQPAPGAGGMVPGAEATGGAGGCAERRRGRVERSRRLRPLPGAAAGSSRREQPRADRPALAAASSGRAGLPAHPGAHRGRPRGAAPGRAASGLSATSRALGEAPPGSCGGACSNESGGLPAVHLAVPTVVHLAVCSGAHAAVRRAVHIWRCPRWCTRRCVERCIYCTHGVHEEEPAGGGEGQWFIFCRRRAAEDQRIGGSAPPEVRWRCNR
jgi:hypothetical protein